VTVWTSVPDDLNKVASVRYPDGRLDSYIYQNGTYNSTTKEFTEGSGSDRRVIVVHGTFNDPEGIAKIIGTVIIIGTVTDFFRKDNRNKR
jgi:hypothetical protein